MQAVIAAIIVSIVLVALHLDNRGEGFSQADVDRIKTEILAAYRARDDEATIDKVVMVRTSRQEMTGYVKGKIGKFTVDQDCRAAMDRESRMSFWVCAAK
jgi:hypothetical protein